MFFYLILVTSASVRLEPLRLLLYLWGLKSISTSQRRVILFSFFFFFLLLSFGIVFIHIPPPLTNCYLYTLFYFILYVCFFSPTAHHEWVVNSVTRVCMCVYQGWW